MFYDHQIFLFIIFRRIDRLDQFIEKNLTWGREGPVPKFDDYFNLNVSYYCCVI